jgi:hypothetical protein
VFCSKCGSKAAAGEKFCGSCGSMLETTDARESVASSGPLKRLLLLAGVVTVLVVLVIVSSGGTVDVTGTYINPNDASQSLELRKDGTFVAKAFGLSYTGEWDVQGNVLTLSAMGFVWTERIEGNRITSVMVKQ